MKKIKIPQSSLSDEWPERIKQINIKKLETFKEKGYTKEQLYKKYSKVFVDKYY